MEVGFIGLGAMGAGMARNLVRAGHAVAVWNRTKARAEPLVAEGAVLAATPREAARAVTITMLADDAATEAATFGEDGLLAGLPPGGLHAAMGTIGVDTARRLAALHEEAGRGYLAAPVFGRPDAAAAAKLFVVAAGQEARIEAARPVLEAMGQKVFVVGEAPEQANLVKLAGNFLNTCVVQGLGETTALVEKAGVDPKAFLDLLTGVNAGWILTHLWSGRRS